MKHNYLKIIFTTLIAVVASMAAMAQEYVKPQSLDEAINTPYIKDNKSRNAIASYQSQQALILSEDRNLNVFQTRNQEVIIITITADQLFETNSNILSHDGERLLKPYASLFKKPLYSILSRAYSDYTTKQTRMPKYGLQGPYFGIMFKFYIFLQSVTLSADA